MLAIGRALPRLLLVSLLMQASQFFIGSSAPASPSAWAATTRTNFLIIMSDDQRYDTMEFMPRTNARIFAEGVAFPNAYATTPLCCPSRASILTGMYAHNHSVRVNADRLLKETFIQRLQKSGYYTGQVGKYLNSWDGSARPEFNLWVAFAGGGSRYFDPRLNVNGTWRVQQGYITYILRDYALEFLRRAAQQEKPFVLLFSPNAPHFFGPDPGTKADESRPPDPAPGDEGLYGNLPKHRPPNFKKTDLSAKPRWIRSRPPLTPDLIAKIDIFRQKQLQTLNSLDQAINSLLNALAEQGKLDDTLVIYLSDNGHFWGEHRIPWGKLAVYEEASRVPFAVRYPRLVSEPRLETRLVANIDIAPTIYELAGIPIPPEVDGRSLVPLLGGKRTQTTASMDWREDLLLEGWPTAREVKEGQAPYAAVHTGRYVYVETRDDRSELYDLEQDPYQLVNRINDPAYAEIVADMKERLKRLRAPGEVVSPAQPATKKRAGERK